MHLRMELRRDEDFSKVLGTPFALGSEKWSMLCRDESATKTSEREANGVDVGTRISLIR